MQIVCHTQGGSCQSSWPILLLYVGRIYLKSLTPSPTMAKNLSSYCRRLIHQMSITWSHAALQSCYKQPSLHAQHPQNAFSVKKCLPTLVTGFSQTPSRSRTPDLVHPLASTRYYKKSHTQDKPLRIQTMPTPLQTSNPTTMVSAQVNV